MSIFILSKINSLETNSQIVSEVRTRRLIGKLCSTSVTTSSTIFAPLHKRLCLFSPNYNKVSLLIALSVLTPHDGGYGAVAYPHQWSLGQASAMLG